MTAAPRLENWAPISQGFGLVSPEKATRLRGQVYGRVLYRDGDMIHSPTIVGFDEEGKAVMESGIRYDLGAIDPAYAAAYPDALAKLVRKFPRVT